MKKPTTYIFFLIVILILIMSNKIKPNCNCQAIALINSFQTEIPLYSDLGKTKIYTIINDTLKEDYYDARIIKLQGDFAYVSTSATLYDTISQKGWINTKFIGIRPSVYNDTLYLYSRPDKNSKIKSKFFNPPWDYFDISDCSQGWLYIKYQYNSKIYEGWMSPEDQCSNIYTTCN